MTSFGDLHSAQAVQVRRSSWVLLLLITAVCLLSYHNMAHAKNLVGEYNASQDELIADVADGSLTHRIALLVLGSCAVISIARHRANGRLRVDGSLSWFVMSFAAWAFISLFWAEDVPLSLRRVVALGIIGISAIAVVQRASIRAITLWIFFSTSLFVSIGIVAEVFFGTFQPFASGYRFAGTMHPNYQGMQCALLLLSATAAADMVKRRRVFFLACAGVAFVLLILTGSRTSLAAAMLGLVVYLVTVSPRATKVATVFGFSIVICLLPLSLSAGVFSDLKTAVLLGRDDPGNVDSLSGRMLIWQNVGNYISQRPMLGYGYGGFWTPTHIWLISERVGEPIPNSHSTYVEYLVTLGPVGLIAYSLLLFAGIRRALHSYKLSHNPGFAFCGALLAFCVLNGFLEVVLVEGSPLMFPTIVVLVYLAFIPSPRYRAVALRGRAPSSSVVEIGRKCNESVS